jgi:sirohydrochlorin cobaltochelatase
MNTLTTTDKPEQPARRAVILFAHGSRDPLWRGPIEAVAALAQRSAPEVPVRCAYLELCTPDLASSVQALLPLGVTSITVVPMFLGMGKHAREDLPQLMAELAQQHPQVRFAVRPAVGEDPEMIALLAQLALS